MGHTSDIFRGTGITPIRRRLLELGKTQQVFAQEVGVTQATASNWVNFKVLPHARRIKAVANALDMKPPEFLDLISGHHG